MTPKDFYKRMGACIRARLCVCDRESQNEGECMREREKERERERDRKRKRECGVMRYRFSLNPQI